MTKDDYYMLLGKYTHAKEERIKERSESERFLRELQSWMNDLRINKPDEQSIANGHALIDKFFERKKMQEYWELEEAQIKEALNGRINPPE